MPHRGTDDPENVLFNDMHKPFADYALDEDTMAAWSGLIQVRDAVNAALEAARAEKKIGKSLEAKVTVPSSLMAEARQVDMDTLADILIVSQVSVSSDVTEVQVEVAQGGKCERCWKVLPGVGSDAAHPTLCPRCGAVVAKLPQF